ncbi:antibiotic biosynthesis monooxygenase [Micromonospora sp. KC606]|nr:antibiotic biosynthesis monooxygenase [Micromonospora sp. KC606]
MAILKVTRTEDAEGYARMLARMLNLAPRQPGYLGRESASTDDGDELTIVYFRDDEAIRAWHDHAAHLVAQHRARSRWYESYEVHIALVERSYRWARYTDGPPGQRSKTKQ